MSDRLSEKKLIYFTGYRGTGKTSVAQVVAQRFGMPCLDLDALIVEAAGRTIAEIFETDGEQEFRDLETSQLIQMDGDSPSVVSLGGGAILRPENRDHIRATGRCIWLDADSETLIERLRQDENTSAQRPGLTECSFENEVREMLQTRQADYKAAAHFRIDTSNLSISEVAEAAVEWLR